MHRGWRHMSCASERVLRELVERIVCKVEWPDISECLVILCVLRILCAKVATDDAGQPRRRTSGFVRVLRFFVDSCAVIIMGQRAIAPLLDHQVQASCFEHVFFTLFRLWRRGVIERTRI